MLGTTAQQTATTLQRCQVTFTSNLCSKIYNLLNVNTGQNKIYPLLPIFIEWEPDTGHKQKQTKNKTKIIK